MKKRLWAALLAVAMSLSILVIPTGAAETTNFSDVSDQNTALAVETLRLMGVLDGYSDGTFRPNQQLTRAQFCKMATYAMGAENELGLYNTVTVFPDVKPSHWAAGYVNMAAKGKDIIAGYPDGRFYPDRTVTVGQAVTILLRLLGYQEDKIGGVWPPQKYCPKMQVEICTDCGRGGLRRGRVPGAIRHRPLRTAWQGPAAKPLFLTFSEI